jgi:hypothetical protein
MLTPHMNPADIMRAKYLQPTIKFQNDIQFIEQYPQTSSLYNRIEENGRRSGSTSVWCQGMPSFSTKNIVRAMLITFAQQNDSWGKKGKESIVAQLWSKFPNQAPIDDSKHYSEVNSVHWTTYDL